GKYTASAALRNTKTSKDVLHAAAASLPQPFGAGIFRRQKRFRHGTADRAAYAEPRQKRFRTAKPASALFPVLRKSARQQGLVVAGKHPLTDRFVGDIPLEAAGRGDDAHGKVQRFAAAVERKVQKIFAAFRAWGTDNFKKTGLGSVVPGFRLCGQP